MSSKNEETIKNLEMMKEILMEYMRVSYEMNCEMLSKIDVTLYQIVKDELKNAQKKAPNS